MLTSFPRLCLLAKVHDTIDFAWNILTTEMNSATDNPMIFQVGLLGVPLAMNRLFIC